MDRLETQGALQRNVPCDPADQKRYIYENHVKSRLSQSVYADRASEKAVNKIVELMLTRTLFSEDQLRDVLLEETFSVESDAVCETSKETLYAMNSVQNKQNCGVVSGIDTDQVQKSGIPILLTNSTDQLEHSSHKNFNVTKVPCIQELRQKITGPNKHSDFQVDKVNEQESHQLSFSSENLVDYCLDSTSNSGNLENGEKCEHIATNRINMQSPDVEAATYGTELLQTFPPAPSSISHLKEMNVSENSVWDDEIKRSLTGPASHSIAKDSTNYIETGIKELAEDIKIVQPDVSKEKEDRIVEEWTGDDETDSANFFDFRGPTKDSDEINGAATGSVKYDVETNTDSTNVFGNAIRSPTNNIGDRMKRAATISVKDGEETMTDSVNVLNDDITGILSKDNSDEINRAATFSIKDGEETETDSAKILNNDITEIVPKNNSDKFKRAASSIKTGEETKTVSANVLNDDITGILSKDNSDEINRAATSIKTGEETKTDSEIVFGDDITEIPPKDNIDELNRAATHIKLEEKTNGDTGNATVGVTSAKDTHFSIIATDIGMKVSSYDFGDNGHENRGDSQGTCHREIESKDENGNVKVEIASFNTDLKMENTSNICEDVQPLVPSANKAVKEYRSTTCVKCNKTYTDHYHLKRHMLIHNDIRPFKCDICGNRFTQSYHLKRHMLIHTKTFLFECNICGKGFFQNFHLKRHLKTHKTSRKSKSLKKGGKVIVGSTEHPKVSGQKDLINDATTFINQTEENSTVDSADKKRTSTNPPMHKKPKLSKKKPSMVSSTQTLNTSTGNTSDQGIESLKEGLTSDLTTQSMSLQEEIAANSTELGQVKSAGSKSTLSKTTTKMKQTIKKQLLAGKMSTASSANKKATANCAKQSTRSLRGTLQKNEPHKCSKSRYVVTAGDSKQHLQNHTTKTPGDTSVNCTKSSASSSALSLNKAKQTQKSCGEKKFQCSVCSKGFSKPYLLKRHMLSHCQKKLQNRFNVPKSSTKDKGLKKSNAKAQGGTEKLLFKCLKCDKVFGNKSNLSWHVTIHSEKMLKCTKCVKVFRNTGNLHFHMKAVHDKTYHRKQKQSQKGTKYDKGASSSSINESKKQGKIHSSMSLFKCSKCKKAFATAGKLMQHVQVHNDTTEKRQLHKCPKCSRVFASKAVLKKHTDNILNCQETLQCIKCHIVCGNAGALKRHLKVHEGTGRKRAAQTS